MARALIVSILLIFILLLSSCVGPGPLDWELALLNNYTLIHINSNSVKLQYKGSSDSNDSIALNGEIIGSIKEFCLNDRFICVHTSSDGLEENVKKTSDVIPAYYAIDTKEHNVYGPFTQTELSEKCQELEIDGLSDWEKTSPAPENAIFD